MQFKERDISPNANFYISEGRYGLNTISCVQIQKFPLPALRDCVSNLSLFPKPWQTALLQEGLLAVLAVMAEFGFR
jgi:hypothetical protein